MRIFTGAPVPEGADTIVIQENVKKLDGDTIEVFETVAAGRHIRAVGLDFAEGETLLETGRVLDAAALSLAAAANHPAAAGREKTAGGDHRHRRRTAAARQRTRARPDHRLERLWRRGDRRGGRRRVLDLGIAPRPGRGDLGAGQRRRWTPGPT